jgi:hypothetical protein
VRIERAIPDETFAIHEPVPDRVAAIEWSSEAVCGRDRSIRIGHDRPESIRNVGLLPIQGDEYEIGQLAQVGLKREVVEIT